MAPDEISNELIQLKKLVAWIDEQRKQDRDVISRLNQQVERLSGELRDSTIQLTALHEEARRSQTAIARLPIVEAGIRQVREQLDEMQRQTEEVEQRGSHNAALQQTELGRLAKALGELSDRIGELYRRDEGQLSRVQLLGEEIKHDRAAVTPLLPRIEHVEKLWTAVGNRTQLFEEQLKRIDGLVAALGQTDEALREEQKRYLLWQQSAELRWARQLAEWQQQMEQWQRLLDDQAKVVQELLKESIDAKEGLDGLRRGQVEHQEELQSQLNTIRKLESVQEVVRQEIDRWLQSLDLQRRRADEQAGNLRGLEESLRQEAAETAALGRRVDGEHNRIDELAVVLRQREEEQRDDRGDLEALEQEMRAQRQELKEELASLGRDLGALRQSQRDWLGELIALQEQHRARQIDELERERRELREQGEAIGATDGVEEGV